jgi:hypothetical protein
MLSNVIDFLDKNEPLPFIAPILTKDTTKVLTIQNNIPYWFKVQVDTPGWYTCAPENGQLTVEDEVYPHERIQYLEQLDRFYVIALFPLDETAWLVSPYNLGDAEQRGWKDGEPRPMYLVEGTLHPLTMVKARVLGEFLLYDGMAVAIHHIRHGKNLASKHAIGIFNQRVAEIEKQEKEHRKEQEKQSQEERLETSLSHVGATLVDWTRNIDGYEVTWEINGRERTMTIDTNLRVLSAGVCLDGTDNWHSLSSIVAVMEDSYRERGY